MGFSSFSRGATGPRVRLSSWTLGPRALLSLALVLMAWAPAASAQQPDLRAHWAERLLTLRGGLVLRTEARLVDGQWQRRADHGRQLDALPEHAVLSQRRVHEAVAELRERRRQAPRASGAARLPLVEWMFHTGLYAEALQELDRVFDEQPNCREALDLLARPDVPLRLPAHDLGDPASVASLVDYGARSPASLQELVLVALGQAPLAAQRDLLPVLEQGLTDENPIRRQFCARALRRLFPGTDLPDLIRRSALDPAQEVRRQAALALGDSGEEASVDPLARALTSENGLLRTRAAQALGWAGFVAAVEPLALRLTTLKPGGGGGPIAPRGSVFVGRQISYVQDFDPEVATRATIAKPIIGVAQAGATLDVRVAGVSGPTSYASETATLRHSLAALTGLSLKDTNAAWKDWWAEQGREWLAEHRSGEQGAEPLAEGEG